MSRTWLSLAVVVLAALSLGGCGGDKLIVKTADDIRTYISDLLRGTTSANDLQLADEASRTAQAGYYDAAPVRRFEGVFDAAPEAACFVAKAAKDRAEARLVPPLGTLNMSGEERAEILAEASSAGHSSGSSIDALDAVQEMAFFTLAATADTACEIAQTGI